MCACDSVVLRALRYRLYFHHEITVKQRVFIDPAFCITSRVAHDPRPVEHVVKTVMGMTVYPQLGVLSVNEMPQIGHKAAIQQ